VPTLEGVYEKYMEHVIYDWSYYFLIYAALGWCSEVIFIAIEEKTFINRGFLGGPVCPIYGFGICLVVLCLSPLKKYYVLFYLCAALLTSVIEFATGFLLKHFFNEKWWDYSAFPLNIGGYVCLPFTLLWGVGCVAVVYWVHPLVIYLVSMLPYLIGWIILILLAGLLATDVYLTLNGILKLKKTSSFLNDIEEIICKTSDTIGSNIAGLVLTAVEGKEKSVQKFDELKGKYRELLDRNGIRNIGELREKYKDLLGKSELRIGKRLAIAFPHLRKHRIFDMVEKRLQSIKRMHY
jgi:uncharacterized membrane protein